MGKKSYFVPMENSNDLENIRKDYAKKISTDPKYSLEVDPEGKYKMTQKQKEFVKYYCEFKNIPLVAQLIGLDEAEAKSYFMALGSQEEIRRINLAMYHRQFNNKMLSVDQLGGYITSLLMDEVPIASQLNQDQKLKAIELNIKLLKLKQGSLNGNYRDIVDLVEINDDIKDLSSMDIKKLLSTIKSNDHEKEKIIKELNEKNNFNSEEIAYLKTLSIDELINLKNGEENES